MTGLHCLSAGAILVAWVGATAQLPIEKLPSEHLKFESDVLSVLEPTMPSGTSQPEHVHAHDSASVCFSGSNMRTRNHKADWSDIVKPCSLGDIVVAEFAGAPVIHAVENVGAGIFHTVMVENMRNSGWSTDPPSSSPATVLAKESRAFLIYAVTLSAATRETEQVHNKPTVVILVSGHVTVGKKPLRKPGQWILASAGAPCSISTQTEAKLIEIEVR